MVDRDTVRRGYDELAETYAAERSADGRDAAILSAFLSDIESAEREGRILDIGCGQGAPILRRLSESATAIGIDVSREQLRLATTNAPDAACLHGDMTRLPIRDGTCVAITAIHSLFHVPLEDQPAVIDEFARVLRPGGRVLLSDGTDEWCGTNPDWLESDVEMQWNVAGIDATRARLRDAGIAITHEWGVSSTFADADERWVFVAGRLEE